MKVYKKIYKSFKFTSKSWLKQKKVKNYKSKDFKRILKPFIRMDRKIMKLDGTEIKKYNLHQYKSPMLIGNINNNKMGTPNKASFGKKDFKYFIGYKKIDFWAKMSTYKDFDKNKCTSFSIKKEKLLEKCNETGKKVNNIIKK